MDSCLVFLVFNQGDDPIACLNKEMGFLIIVASLRFPSTNDQLRTSSNLRNQATIQDGRVTVQQVQGRQGQSYDGNSYKGNATSSGGNNQGGQARVTTIPYIAAFETEDLDAYDSDCDDVSNAKAVLMANLSNYGSDIISKEKAKQEKNNESLTAELERYKERVKTFEQRLNINLSTHEKMIDSQMDDMIKEKLALNESRVKCLDIDAELLDKQNAYNDLSKSYSQLEKHCISLELTMQLNQEVFQNNSLSNNQNALEIPEYFKNNNLKAQLQAKDTTICMLKEHIKSMRENDKEEKVKHEMGKIKTINIILEHSVAKLLYENECLHKEIEHLKKIYKDQFDSIKKTCALSKEHGDSLIAQLNSKSIENADLKRQIQDNVFMITSLKNDLRKLKRKEIVKNVAQILIATTISPGMFKIYLNPLAPRLLNNREGHIDYLKHTQEQANILRGIVKQAKSKQPLDNALDFSCKHAKRIQRLLVYVRDTCPNAYKRSEKLIAVTPMNKVKKVRFYEPLTSLSNIQ
nr:hypothetical protein [Tanacetum cinerariifolium]